MGNIISTNEDITFTMPSGSVKLAVSYESDYIKIDGSGIVSATDLLKSLTAETPVDLMIPSTLNGITVTGIGTNGFKACKALRSVTISEGITTINEYAFYQCTSLASVILPNTIDKIPSWAFAECKSLTSINIPDSVTYIFTGAFSECIFLSSVTIGKGVSTIRENTFYGCTSLTSIDIPANVGLMYDNVFLQCTALTVINIYKPQLSIKGIPWGAPLGSSIVKWLG